MSDQLVRRLIWDSSTCGAAPAVLDIVGLPGQSEEVADMEHDESHRRTGRLAALQVPLQTMSDALGKINAKLSEHVAIEGGVEVPPGALAELEAGYRVLIVSSAVAILSQLIDAGLLATTTARWSG